MDAEGEPDEEPFAEGGLVVFAAEELSVQRK